MQDVRRQVSSEHSRVVKSTRWGPDGWHMDSPGTAANSLADQSEHVWDRWRAQKYRLQPTDSLSRWLLLHGVKSGTVPYSTALR